MSNYSEKLETRLKDSKTIEAKKDDILSRLKSLEDNLESLSRYINDNLGDTPARLSTLETLAEATVNLAGYTPEVITAQVRKQQLDAKKAQVEAEKKQIQDGLDKGWLVVEDAVTANSMIIGTETNSDGTFVTVDSAGIPVHEGRVQTFYNQLVPNFKEMVLSKKVGDSVDTPTGGKFTINEIYRIDTDGLKAHLQKDVNKTVEAVQAVDNQDENMTVDTTSTTNTQSESTTLE